MKFKDYLTINEAPKWVVKLTYKLQDQGKSSDEINKAIKAKKAEMDKKK